MSILLQKKYFQKAGSFVRPYSKFTLVSTILHTTAEVFCLNEDVYMSGWGLRFSRTLRELFVLSEKIASKSQRNLNDVW